MNSRSLLLSLALATSSLTACGGPLRYQVRSPIDIQADAQVVARVQEAQKQTQLEITVTKLAPPDRVAPAGSFTTYVAWARSGEDVSWVRLGALKYDTDEGLGELTATTNETAFDLAISAEAAADAQAPSTAVVFLQSVNKE